MKWKGKIDFSVIYRILVACAFIHSYFRFLTSNFTALGSPIAIHFACWQLLYPDFSHLAAILKKIAYLSIKMDTFWSHDLLCTRVFSQPAAILKTLRTRLVFDWIAGPTQVNSPKHKRGFIFQALSVARLGYKAILHQLYFWHSQRFLCSGRKRFGKCFLSAFFAGFNPVWHIMIAVVHTGGYGVIQVKHWRDINLILSVYF